MLHRRGLVNQDDYLFMVRKPFVLTTFKHLVNFVIYCSKRALVVPMMKTGQWKGHLKLVLKCIQTFLCL